MDSVNSREVRDAIIPPRSIARFICIQIPSWSTWRITASKRLLISVEQLNSARSGARQAEPGPHPNAINDSIVSTKKKESGENVSSSFQFNFCTLNCINKSQHELI